jgi:rubrerythrin
MKNRDMMAFAMAAVGVGLLTFNSSFAGEAIQAQTRQDLMTAMQYEAMTVLKYTAFAQHARKDGRLALAELMEQTANAEQRHFTEFARLYGLFGEDWQNLANAIVGEYSDYSQTYVSMAERADATGNTEVANSFRVIAAEETKHHAAFQAAVAKSLRPD